MKKGTRQVKRNIGYWKGYIEKVGTGTEDIIEKCRNYGLKRPEFYQEDDFRVVIWRANGTQSDQKASQKDLDNLY